MTTLVIRLSSLGDVAIAIPVLYSMAIKYPDDHFLLLTQSAWQSLFVDKPSNLTVFPVYTKDKHKGIKGIIRLLRELSPVTCTKKVKVADLHGVVRSFFIDWYFRFRGNPVAVIDKGRGEKQKLVRQNHKILHPLKTSLDRYREVFEKLGYDSSLSFTGLFSEKPANEQIRIGIAPFAKHKGKTYPLELMEKVVCRLSELSNLQIVLWGSKEERECLENWSKKYRNVTSVAGQMPLNEELFLMNQMDLMVSMDSANMHLASLVNTPVVSIWGATHPYAGFYGFNHDESNIVQIKLPCRPCSIFGNKPCHRGDYACLKQITPEMIVDKIKDILLLYPQNGLC
jgi:ADP-heptose:LPS heptosyltransferase